MRYFLAVRDRGSIQIASAVLHLSPQALSEHIKRIEAELGTALLNKTRPVTLTRAGDCFARNAESFLTMQTELERELSEIAGRRKQLLISTPMWGSPPFLAEIIREFSHRTR